MNLKLNLKRTFLIGFAFFGICLLWQVYDSWCPTFLTDIFSQWKYGMTSADLKAANNTDAILQVQWLVGIVMACDNLAALILLPIFGNLSDKTKTPIGKRMPFILIGTFVSAIAFPFVPLFFHYNNILGMVIMMGIILMFMMMYRNPAVSLMPDITPKPLRAKANGIINIMGYFGGAFATVLGIFLPLSNYINASSENRNVWLIEIPFIVASLLMVISAMVLFFTIKENKLAKELEGEMAEGEKYAAIEDAVDDDKPMSKANKIMLWAILIAEFLWFMAENSISTYIGNYIIYALEANSSNSGTLTIVGGVASVAGFAVAGFIADTIGRKYTVASGLALTVIGMIIMVLFVHKLDGTVDVNTTNALGETITITYHKFPTILYVTWILKGFGMALVHNCSFPMVVELCSSKKIGKFTGYYYTASMAAQTVTPVLLGIILATTKVWKALPIYSTIFYIAAVVVFFLFVKNINAEKVKNAKGLEALGDDD